MDDFNNSGKRLIIVFINGSTVSSRYLNDPKYAEIVKLIPKKYLSGHDRRESIISYFEEQLTYMRRDKERLLPPFGAQGQYEWDILYRKAEIFKYKSKINNKNI